MKGWRWPAPHVAEGLQGGKEAASALQTPSLTSRTALGPAAAVYQLSVCVSVHASERQLSVSSKQIMS